MGGDAGQMVVNSSDSCHKKPVVLETLGQWLIAG